MTTRKRTGKKPAKQAARSTPTRKAKAKAKATPVKAKAKTKAKPPAKAKAKAKPPAKAKAKAKAKVTKATTSPPAIALPDIATTCAAIEAFFDAVRAREDEHVSLYAEPLEPQPAAAIAKLEQELAVNVPDGLRAFLARGLRNATGSLDHDEDFTGVGFDFSDVDSIIHHTKLLRESVGDTADRQADVIRTGIALTTEEPELVLASDGSVHHWTMRNPELRVTSSFHEFLVHWAASGCMSSHNFKPWWTRVGDLAPLGIPPKQNRWLLAYKKQFPDFVAF